MTADDVVWAAFRKWIADTPIDEADKIGGFDFFLVVPSAEALRANERDRVTYVQVAQGPAPKAGARCINQLRLAVGTRFFNEFDSQARMLRDVPLLRERMRTAVAPNIAGLQKVEVGVPIHDYSTIEKVDLVVFDVLLEYHVEV